MNDSDMTTSQVYEARERVKDAAYDLLQACKLAEEELLFDSKFCHVSRSGERRNVDEALAVVREAIATATRQEEPR